MKKYILKGALLSALFATVVACQKDDKDANTASQGDFNRNALNAYVAKLPSVKQREPFAEPLFKGENPQNASLFSNAAYANAEGDVYEQAKAFEDQLLFSEDQEVFFPGLLINGHSVTEGTYKAINVDRAPIKLSVSL